MVDFHQEGIITTLHGLHEIFDTRKYLENLEQKLEHYARHVRISLLLPCLYSELSVPHVLDNIVENINQVNYLHHVVVALGGTGEWQRFKEAKDFFGHLKKRGREVKIVWVDGPRMQSILRKIEEAQIPVGDKGKGQSVWLALGYLSPGTIRTWWPCTIATCSPTTACSSAGSSNPPPIPTTTISSARGSIPI